MVNLEPQELQRRKIIGSRNALLVILICSVINVVMAVLDNDTHFLFSFSLPFYFTMLGKGLDNGFLAANWDATGTYTYTGLVLSALVVGIFLLCWAKSKHHPKWLMGAFVLALVDTTALAFFSFTLYDDPLVNLFDFLFHLWILFDLGKGASAAKKLCAPPPEEPPEPQITLFQE